MANGGADCIVVGAGIAGVCTALHLQKAGARVTIMDAGEPGSGASFGNAGIVVNTKLAPVFAGLTAGSLFAMLRDPSSPLNLRWSRVVGLAPWFLRMLAHARADEVRRITAALAQLCQSGERIYADLWHEAGMGEMVLHRGSLALNLTIEDRDRDWDGGLAALRAIGVPMERVGGAEIKSLAPAVGPRYMAGVYSPDFRHTVDPQAFVQTLFKLFETRGGGFRREQVRGVEVRGGKLAGLRTANGVVAAGSVVLAAGTGTAALARQLGEAVPHQAVGGYHVVLARPGIELETPLLPMDFRFAITPMRAGIRLAGTYEFGGEGLPQSGKVVRDMLAHVRHVLPGIHAEASSTWRGFRSYLPDGLPVISASRAADGVFYLFGLSSAGMINGAAAGRALARLWHGDEPEIDLASFAIDRFNRRRTARPDGAQDGRKLAIGAP